MVNRFRTVGEEEYLKRYVNQAEDLELVECEIQNVKQEKSVKRNINLVTVYRIDWSVEI